MEIPSRPRFLPVAGGPARGRWRGVSRRRPLRRARLRVLRLALWVLRLPGLRVLRRLRLVTAIPRVCHPRDSALPPRLICAVAHYRDGLAHLLGGFDIDVGYEQLGVGPC